jgi:hypothetical protein
MRPTLISSTFRRWAARLRLSRSFSPIVGSQFPPALLDRVLLAPPVGILSFRLARDEKRILGHTISLMGSISNVAPSISRG